MKHGWTGGQYSLYRGVFGVYLTIHYAQLLPWGVELFSNRGALPLASDSPLYALFPNLLAVADAPGVVTALIAGAVVSGLLLVAGKFDRAAALYLWYVGACLVGRNPLILNPALPFLGWLLLAHACIPPAPFGSWAARGRVDPRGDWQLPRRIHGAAWIVMALGYSYSGYTKLISPSWVDGSALARILENPLARPGLLRELLLSMPAALLQFASWGALALELAFAPLALFARLRPWLWLSMLSMHLTLMLVIDFAELSFGMVVLHLFTFDPRWVRPSGGASADTLFYDGGCGLCHHAVRFVLAEDCIGVFRFSPLEGKTFDTRVPDSLVVTTSDGRLLTRALAVRHLLRRLGGFWRCLATASRIVPVALLDRAYDAVAAIRHRLFRRPTEACPVLPGDLRERFEE